MSSKTTGNQEPRIRVEPKRVSSDGDDAALLAKSYGLAPDPWQCSILDCWLGRDSHDKFTSRNCGLSVPRQNGKNALLEMRELYGLSVIGERVLHSAHEVKTAAEAFRRLCSFFENKEDYPELNDLLLRVRRTNGQEAIELTNGGLIRFSARSRGAARGMTFDLIVLDEAQELTDEQMEAMIPTKSSAPLGNPQTIFTGTPPNGGCGIVFGRTRKNIIDGKKKNSCWHEWSVEEIGDLSTRFALSKAYKTNPALGIRIREEDVLDELVLMSPEGFARERLGWWDDRSQLGECVVKEKDWDDLITEAIPDNKQAAFGIKFSLDGGSVAVSVAAVMDGYIHVELVYYETLTNGMMWLVDFCKEKVNEYKGFAVDGKSNATAFVEELKRNNVPAFAIHQMSTNDAISSCSGFINAIGQKSIRHNGDAVSRQSVTSATKRKIGTSGGFGFKGTEEVEATPLDSLAIALWAVQNIKRDPRKRVKRIW